MGRLFKEMVILGVAGIALLYLFNPTAGFLEFLPDNLPLVGNLDEATAVMILASAARYYGLDLTRLFGKSEPPRETVTPPRQPTRR